MDPIPTPHDITPIPQMPYSAPFELWIVTFILLLVVAAVVIFIARTKSGYISSAFSTARAELRSIRSRSNSPAITLGEVAAITKRLLAAIGKAHLKELSPNEIKALIENYPDGAERRVIETVLEVENSRFNPGTTADQAERLIGELLTRINTLEELVLSSKR